MLKAAGVQRPCPSCAGTAARLAFADVNRREGLPISGQYLRCIQCGTLFLDPLPEPGRLREAYVRGEVDPAGAPATAPAPALATRLSPGRAALRALSELLTGRPHSWPEGAGRGRKLLDFGCLGGGKLVEFHQRGFSVVGVDLNKSALASARALLPAGRFYESLDQIPAEDRYDVIRLDNVLEHLEDPAAILCTLRGRLSPRGKLFVYVPSGEALSVRLLGARSANVWIPWHLQLFSGAGLRRLLERTGFSGVRLRRHTPLSWWHLSLRQLLAAPGFARRAPGLKERAAGAFGFTVAPALGVLGRTGVGEELIAQAATPEKEGA